MKEIRYATDNSVHVEFIVDPKLLEGQSLVAQTRVVPFDRVKHLLSDKPLHRPRRGPLDSPGATPGI